VRRERIEALSHLEVFDFAAAKERDALCVG
jgi:hypothetical protein